MNDDLFSTSPRTSVLSADSEGLHPFSLESNYKTVKNTKELTLDEFIHLIPSALQQRKDQYANVNDHASAAVVDPILTLFDRVRLDHCDWDRYAFYDDHKNYTRNLVATDHKTFTLLLLCWTPGRESPIHDHPCDGCWLRVLEGTVRECRYQRRPSQENGDIGSGNVIAEDPDSHLICSQDATFHEGDVCFIEDSQGYHKIGNPSHDTPAVTLHLYSPPFQTCRIWLDENRKPCKSTSCLYSAYGEKL